MHSATALSISGFQANRLPPTAASSTLNLHLQRLSRLYEKAARSFKLKSDPFNRRVASIPINFLDGLT
jgi:hypothetical protein